MQDKREKHIRAGRHLKDIIFAANDGIITTFAVIAGISGAGLSQLIIIIVGFSSLIADAFSMSTGNYLGTKSEKEFYAKEEEKEKEEIMKIPEKEKEEIRIILANKGYKGKDLESIVALIASNKKAWVDLMMRDELHLFIHPDESPIKNAIITFISFITAGGIPLFPYIFFDQQNLFIWAGILASITLFVIGSLRSLFSNRSWFISGIEMLLIGGLAGLIAYYIGFLIQIII